MTTTRRYSKEHEWAERQGDIVTIGITDYAQAQLGDVVYVELPNIGQTVVRHNAVAVVESVKAASEVYAPLSGTVAEINTALVGDPAQVNGDPEGGAWFFKLRLSVEAEWGELMDKGDYERHLQNAAH
jgi:glycine cleavage system H protein